MAKYLVTGGAGFIGGHLVEALVRRGHTVTVFDDLSSGSRENLAAVEGNVELIQGDLRSVEGVRRASKGKDGVFHQGAAASVPWSIREPRATNEINITGTLNVLATARENDVRRVVMASSSSVYGNAAALPKVESMGIEPLSPYALQKAAGEYYARMFHPLYGLETVALRYFNIFGPRQDPKSEYAAVIPRFITKMLAGERPLIFGDGSQSRDFAFVENAVNANIAAMEAPATACGQAYNVGCGEAISLNHLVECINTILGAKLQPEYAEPRAGDVKHSLADISAAQKNLGYKPAVNFQDGLRRTIDWFRSAR